MKIKSPNRPTPEHVRLLAEYEVLVILDVGLVSNVGLILNISCRSEIEFKFGFEIVMSLCLRLWLSLVVFLLLGYKL